ncbi:MAG: nitrite reductase small subunit NirD [Gammaproteobacteria bacterium]|nr:nitrite reductase small subunit NirD [Gammaproteobacteria bacterium]
MSDWIEIGTLIDIPKSGARVVRRQEGDIAVFRTAEDKVFALRDKCPHKGGQLSQGIVLGDRVACPLHDWKIGLENGVALAPDSGCAASFPIKMQGETILLSLTPNDGCANS